MERNNSQSTNNRDGPLLLRSEPRSTSTTSSEFVLQWGNRKRLRCMKIQDSSSGSGRPMTRVNRRVIRSDPSKDPNWINAEKSLVNVNLRQRPPSPSYRILRNSESWIGMKGHSNGVKGLASPDRGGDKIKASSNTNHQNKKNSNINGSHQNDHHHHQHQQAGGGGGSGGSGSSETAHEGKKGGLLSGNEPVPVVWPPKFVISLTNKEKEEDFMAIKGSKLPQRPKKRAKLIQRTVNLVCPGSWLCDLTLERYEVREKKVSKKRPRGLKAMGNNIESDSE